MISTANNDKRTATNLTLARLGGDEFDLILRDCDDTVTVDVADKLREVIEDIFETPTYLASLTK